MLVSGFHVINFPTVRICFWKVKVIRENVFAKEDNLKTKL